MLLTFLLVLIIPLVVLIYLSIQLLISRRPRGGFLLGSLLLWLAMLVAMTISAVKSPASFERQISNAFRSVFENDNEALYEEFTEDEIEDFREKLDGRSTAIFTNGDLKALGFGRKRQRETLLETRANRRRRPEGFRRQGQRA